MMIGILAVLVFAVWKFQTAPYDKNLDWKPQLSEINHAQNMKATAPQLNIIRSKNIFSPDRGSEAPSQDDTNGRKSTPPKFELVGICSIGDQAGAIIDVKTNGTSSSGSKKKRYFSLGEEIHDGFKLDSIAENSVVVARNNETLEIKIDGTRFAAEVGKQKAARPISPPSGAPAPTANQPQRRLNQNPGVARPPAADTQNIKPPGA